MKQIDYLRELFSKGEEAPATDVAKGLESLCVIVSVLTTKLMSKIDSLEERIKMLESQRLVKENPNQAELQTFSSDSE